MWIKNNKITEWKNGMDYYKLWLTSIYLGPFKIRDDMNYANHDMTGHNHFLTRFSREYVEGVSGPWLFFIKFISGSRKHLHKFM